LETNEGNARLITSIPNLHVAIVGIEKLVPHVGDAAKLITAHPLSATGQRLTVYVSMLMGPRPLAGASQGRQQHIVLLDNGRRRMRADHWFREGLYCIRCGACMNICPTYGVVGGHVFGHIYPGPIGIPWTAEAHGLEQAAHFAPLCISCGLCKEICPADIDIPMLIARVKERDAELRGHLLVHDVLADAERFARLMQTTAPVSNWILGRRMVRSLLDKALGLDPRRPLPIFVREPFEAWYRRAYRPRGAERKVVYFVDLYANYNEPALARALVDVLARYGLDIMLPAQKSSGMPFIAYGKLEAARKLAAYNVRQLYPWAHKGLPIVATEPTAGYMLRLAYPKLLDTPEARVVAGHVVEPFELLAELHAADTGLRLPQLGGRAGFHISCHQRALGAGGRTVEYLRRAGMEVEVVETGTCCGMAGTFGLKKGAVGYDLSMEVGRPLFERFAHQRHKLIVTESSVCRMHLEHGTGLRVVHPLQLWLNGFAGRGPTAFK
jgi:Fe-S oxidoreductase